MVATGMPVRGTFPMIRRANAGRDHHVLLTVIGPEAFEDRAGLPFGFGNANRLSIALNATFHGPECALRRTLHNWL
jgi:hypothetical protein